MLGLFWVILLLVTGYLLTFFFFKKQDFLWRWAVSFGISISLLVLLGLLLDFYVINSFTVKLALLMVFLLSVIALFLTKKCKIGLPNFDIKEAIFLLSAMLLVFFLIYSPHFNYRFPLHVTEYFYLNHAYKITETGHLCTDPYTDSHRCDAKTGFTALLANIFLLTGMEPLQDYRFLPAIFGIMTALVIFVFVYELAGNFWTSLLAMVLAATIPGNSLILGLILAVPFTVALTLCFLFLLSLHKWWQERSKSYLFLAAVFMFIAFTLHGSTAAYVLVVSVLYFAFNMRKEWKIFSAFILGIIALPAAIFLGWFWRGGILNTVLSNLWRIEFPYYKTNYFLIGIPLAIFALFGLYSATQDRQQKFLAFFFTISLLYFSITSLLRRSYLIRPERLIYIILLFAIFLGCIGFIHFLCLLRKKVRKKNVFVLISAAFLALVFYFQISANFPPVFDYIVNDEEFETLRWLKSHYSAQKIFAHPKFSSAIPITNNTVVSHWMGDLTLTKNATTFFESPSCEKGLRWVGKHKPDLLISEQSLSCDYLEEVQANLPGYFVYEVEKRK